MGRRNFKLYPAQMGLQNYGILQMQVINTANFYPVENATIRIFRKENMETAVDILTTDISGKTGEIELVAPPLEYSLEPGPVLPYANYVVMATAEGFQPVMIDSAQVLPFVKSVQPVEMTPIINGRESLEIITVDDNFLAGNYTPKVFENEIKEMPPGEENKPVVIPELINVHTSVPINTLAANYDVGYVSYIKNVVSTVLYATWPKETINAVIYTTLSFALNRVYTNWYARRGYNFDITSLAAFDQKWLRGRNIFTNISQAVDQVFNSFLSRPDIVQPILTQICRGELSLCPGMLPLWEAKRLGESGFGTQEILNYFFGDSLYINSTDQIEGIVMPWPGTDIGPGGPPEAVLHIQQELTKISVAYRAIPITENNGVYGETTLAAVSEFQNIFDLPVTGITDKATWYKIARVYNLLRTDS